MLNAWVIDLISGDHALVLEGVSQDDLRTAQDIWNDAESLILGIPDGFLLVRSPSRFNESDSVRDDI